MPINRTFEVGRTSWSAQVLLDLLRRPARRPAADREVRPTTQRQRGSALLAVLWMSAALAAIAFSVSSTVRSETDRVATDSDGLRTYYLASGSIERGIQWVLWGQDYRNPDGGPRYWEPNLPRMAMHYPSGDAVVEMIPEASKLNINTATPDDLYRVALTISGDPERARNIASGILDWRSPVNTDVNSGAINNLGLTPSFPARHASFEEIEELLLVRGMTPELFYGNFIADAEGRLYARGGLRDCLSVWGSAGPFDINSVSPALMEAVGVSPETVAQIVQLRSLKPIRSMAEVPQAGGPLPRLGIGGNLIWTLRATARLRRPDGTPSDTVRTSSATIKILDRRLNYQMPVDVLRYYDDAWSQFAVAPPAAAPSSVPAGGLLQ
jgi:general secretion pathway protein K